MSGEDKRISRRTFLKVASVGLVSGLLSGDEKPDDRETSVNRNQDNEAVKKERWVSVEEGMDELWQMQDGVIDWRRVNVVVQDMARSCVFGMEQEQAEGLTSRFTFLDYQAGEMERFETEIDSLEELERKMGPKVVLASGSREKRKRDVLTGNGSGIDTSVKGPFEGKFGFLHHETLELSVDQAMKIMAAFVKGVESTGVSVNPEDLESEIQRIKSGSKILLKRRLVVNSENAYMVNIKPTLASYSVDLDVLSSENKENPFSDSVFSVVDDFNRMAGMKFGWEGGYGRGLDAEDIAGFYDQVSEVMREGGMRVFKRGPIRGDLGFPGFDLPPDEGSIHA